MNPAHFIKPRDAAPDVTFDRHIRGRDLELRFLHAWRQPEAMERSKDWFASVRDASEAADLNHIDAFLVTRWGNEIPVQIKSSELDRILFLKNYGHIEPKIAVVVLRPFLTPNQIRNATFREIRDHEFLEPYWLGKLAEREKREAAARFAREQALLVKARASAIRTEAILNRERLKDEARRLRYFQGRDGGKDRSNGENDTE